MKKLNITHYYQIYASNLDKSPNIIEKFTNDILKKKSCNRLFQIEKFLSKNQRDGLHFMHWSMSKEEVCDWLVEIIGVEHWSEEYEKIYNSLTKYQMCIACAILKTNHQRFVTREDYA